MKRILALVLVLMAFAGCAFADTVSVDLNSATEEELKIARDAIDAKLMEIRLSNAPKMDASYIIHGNGTQILTNVEINAELSRFNIHDANEVDVSCYDANGERLFIFDYIKGQQTIPMIMVESEKDWFIDVSPLGTIDSPYISGQGSYTSDLFVAVPPTIVTITIEDKKGYSNYTDINLYYVDKAGEVHIEDWVAQKKYSSQRFDYIIKPNNEAAAWFWVIDCSDHVKWSITAK